MTVEVRPAALVGPEAEPLVALRRAWVEERHGGPVDDPAFEDRLRAWLADEASHRLAWVAWDGEEPIGMVNLLDYRRMPAPGGPSGGWGYIGQTFVVVHRRSAGVGRLLLDAAVAEARRRGHQRLVLSPSARSVPFYRRAGFAEADQLLVLPL